MSEIITIDLQIVQLKDEVRQLERLCEQNLLITQEVNENKTVQQIVDFPNVEL